MDEFHHIIETEEHLRSHKAHYSKHHEKEIEKKAQDLENQLLKQKKELEVEFQNNYTHFKNQCDEETQEIMDDAKKNAHDLLTSNKVKEGKALLMAKFKNV